MDTALTQVLPASNRPGGRSQAFSHASLIYGIVGVLGIALYWLSANRPSAMPFWAPFEFSPLQYLAMTLTLYWFGRGTLATPRAERGPAWRRVSFVIGMVTIYAVLQTHFEYWSQHMFFLNRIQHVVMHHFGPFLIALGCVGPTLKRGMPVWLARGLEARWIGAIMGVLQNPIVAPVLFVGLLAFWLTPDVHFRAMLDPRLYALMNWSMVLDGILFWTLVLDPRPRPLARHSYGVRAALSLGVMFPQIALGAVIGFSTRDLYPSYDLCGRLLPSIGALSDQHIGGIIIWIPPAMMSVVGMLVVINALRIHEDSITETDDEAAALAAQTSSWTGR